MNSHACLSGASLADMHIKGYVSHRACISLDVHVIDMYLIGVHLSGHASQGRAFHGRASLRACISQGMHLIGGTY